ncbi:putative dUTP pyrophosphatase [Staphylococcus argenteus]|uniref:dUTP diphosphatase n=3 Tax=Staphylococcus argenteus TaxID=985002 RepID=A0A7U7JQH7_9STAP|nr:putative dUTP pyrophosphatase [Staphylococcus argenteus]CRI10797.1 putative dUTP pyrophosphatase [Staphylococcus argenteus]
MATQCNGRSRKMTNILQVKLLSEHARMPERNHKTDAGYDIFSAETVVLEPQEKAVIKTDVAVSIPEGYVGLLTSRSGVSSKTHLVIETGKIDAGYQGNLGINIKNDEERDGIPFLYDDIDAELEDGLISILDIKGNYVQDGRGIRRVYQINKGDKLAQLVIVPIWTPELKQVEEFESVSERGAKGFGSSGV